MTARFPAQRASNAFPYHDVIVICILLFLFQSVPMASASVSAVVPPRRGGPVAPGNYMYGIHRPHTPQNGLRYLFKFGVRQSLLGDPKTTLKFGLFRSPADHREAMVKYTRENFGGYYPESRHVNSPAPESCRSHVYGSTSDISVGSQTQRIALKFVKSYTCDFSKLKSYNWTRTEEHMSRPKAVGDKAYLRKTKSEAGSTTSTPRAPATAPSGEILKGGVDCSKCRLCSKWRGHKKTADTKDHDHISQRIRQLDLWRDQQPVASADEGCLYAQLKSSIGQLQKHDIKSGLQRPLKTERGRYRPISRTTIGTPAISVNGSELVNLDKPSAVAYVEYLRTQRLLLQDHGYRSAARSRAQSAASMRQTDNDTRILESVMDFNKPPDGAFSTGDSDAFSEIDLPPVAPEPLQRQTPLKSRMESRASQTVEIPSPYAE